MIRLARRIALFTLTLTASLWLAYLLLANGALLLAPRTIDRREPVTMSFDAYTLIPGTVHVQNFQMHVEDRWTQWSLDIADASVRVSVLPVLKRTFHAEKVDAYGVVMRLRMKRTTDELANAPEGSYPDIPGMGPPLRDDLRFPFGRPLKNPWTLQMENITAHAQQIWIEGERFDGAAMAEGQFRMAFDREVEVGPTDLQIEGGTLQHRGTEIAQELRGDLHLELGPFNPRRVRDGAVAEQLSVNGELHAAPRKNSKFDAVIALERGVLQQGTSVDVSLPGVKKNFGGLAARGNVLASVAVGAEEKITWSARVSGLRAALLEHPELAVDGGALTVSATTKGTDVLALELPTSARVDLPNARMADLRALNALIPEPLGLNVEGGSGKLDAHLIANLQAETATGTVSLRASSLRIERERQALKGAVALNLRIGKANAKLGRVDLSGSKLVFADMQVIRGGAEAAPWSGAISFSEAKVDVRRREKFTGHVDANFNGMGPLCRAAMEDLHVPGIVRGLFAPNLVSAGADVTFGKKLVEVKELSARVGRLNVRGIAELKGGSKQVLADVSMGRLRVGIERNGDKTHVKPFARHTWFEGKQVALAE